MKILLIHADKFRYEAREKALKSAENLEENQKTFSTSEVLVVFTAVEKNDEKNTGQIAEKALGAIREVAGWIKLKNIVLYPYAHLSSELASPSVAVQTLKQLKTKLLEEDFDVHSAPFGWYKSFEISCRGHPLSELSRTLTVEEAEPVLKKEETVYRILTLDMELHSPEEYVYKAGEEEFRIMVEKEALGKESAGGKKPRFLNYCKKFGMGWESFSDLGHMRYGPEANLIFELISAYSENLVNSLGFPVYRIRGTNMFDLSIPAVNEHAKLFGQRLYEIDVEGRRLVLRYAACHQQFAMLKDWVISYKDLPFGAYELADSYRYEQEGELLLCFRLRKLHMPDLHVICRNLEESKEYAFKIHMKIYDEINKLGRTYVSLYNTTKEFFEGHMEFFRRLLKVEGKPVLLCFVPEKFYWVLNIEYNIIDELNRVREIATCQIDVGNAKRFGITYVDAEGSKVYPSIIHTAIIGTVERYIFTLLDTAAKDELAGNRPMLPVWLSPIQARIVSVSQKQLELSMKVLDCLSKAGVRVDVDDSDETLSKKVLKAETSWVPYIIVAGEAEEKSGEFDVRIRKSRTRAKRTLSELADEIKSKIEGYPYKPLPLPSKISVRPVF